MTEKHLLPSLDPEALFGKSQSFIRKAILRKEGGDLDEYQLWASLALELLGKSCLAKIHPSLIADPMHFHSMFAASGLNISTDIKTIGARTLFERLRHLQELPTFDENTKTFCDGIALRRNAELHSGAAPFRSMQPSAWEAKYWHAAQTILDAMQSSLDDWLGTSQAETPKALLKHALEAKIQAVTIRVERAKENFGARKKADRERALSDAKTRQPSDYSNLFTLLSDLEWACDCPACSGKAFLAGIQVSEDVVDTYGDEDGAWESVEKTYSAEQFHCPVCDLFLDGSDELGATGLITWHAETDDREMEYGPEYGNE